MCRWSAASTACEKKNTNKNLTPLLGWHSLFSLLPDRLLFGGERVDRGVKGTMRGRERGDYTDTRRGRDWNLNPASPGSAVSLLQHPVEESFPGLCTSGRPCHSARQERGGGGLGEGRCSQRVKGTPACPEADSVQLSESLTLPRPPPASQRATTQASGETQGWKSITTLSLLQGEREREKERETGWKSFYRDFFSTSYLSGKASAQLVTGPVSWSVAREFIIHQARLWYKIWINIKCGNYIPQRTCLTKYNAAWITECSGSNFKNWL